MKSELDLGTGAGTCALYAAINGAEVLGVDISASAVEMAKENAIKLGIEGRFITGDVLTLDLNEKFDVVVDSTILHCLLGKEDRHKFYETAIKHMNEDSYLLINTMIQSEDMAKKFPAEFFRFEDGILWSLGIKEIEDRKEIDGKSYFPHRTILSKKDQLEEFKRNGLEVVKMETDEDSSLLALLIHRK